jgi:hypothetical protein
MQRMQSECELYEERDNEAPIKKPSPKKGLSEWSLIESARTLLWSS